MTTTTTPSVRLLAVGDTHGDFNSLASALETASSAEVDWVVQLGDFGYWEHTAQGRRFLDGVSAAVMESAFVRGKRVPVLFIDGNHDNHPLLWDTYANALKTPEGFWKIRPGLFYAPRGHRWTWGAKSFLAVGGAVSIDKAWRTPGQSWWETEEITEEDVTACVEGGPVDVVFSHDVPLSVDPFEGRSWQRFPETEMSRKRLERIVEAVRPSLLVHGHWHHRYTTKFEHRDGFLTQIEGLAADGSPGSTQTLEV